MNFFIQQDIRIHTIRINSLVNSSVLQIGSCGLIKPISNLFNTGGYTQPAPPLEIPTAPYAPETTYPILVPLPGTIT